MTGYNDTVIKKLTVEIERQEEIVTDFRQRINNARGTGDIAAVIEWYGSNAMGADYAATHLLQVMEGAKRWRTTLEMREHVEHAKNWCIARLRGFRVMRATNMIAIERGNIQHETDARLVDFFENLQGEMANYDRDALSRAVAELPNRKLTDAVSGGVAAGLESMIGAEPAPLPAPTPTTFLKRHVLKQDKRKGRQRQPVVKD